MSLSQSQAGEGQESANVGTDSSQTELHCQLGHWDSEGGRNNNQRLAQIFVKLSLLLAHTQHLTKTVSLNARCSVNQY